MNILVTAGNTIVPIDRVRCITNVFTGRTGTLIALHAQEREHTVTLLSSHPELVAMLSSNEEPRQRWSVDAYRTFADLRDLLASKLSACPFDVVIHCAAVNDYEAAGIYAPAPGISFCPEKARWQITGPPHGPAFVDRSAGKIKSAEPELWLRLIRTPKLIDLIRADWGFGGILIKFKLEVGVSEEHLLEIAESSRGQSGAELMVANTLEGASSWAMLGPVNGRYERVSRADLPRRLLDATELLYKEAPVANVLLGVTGSVAALRTPALYEALTQAGYQVKVVATQAALYFFDPAALDPIESAQPQRNPAVVVLDEDEWPGRSKGQRYQREDPVLHIELRRWARVLLIAPLDANTLAKLANGLADNCLTSVWRAWDPQRPVILAPAMNTLMWEHPLTVRHLRQVAAGAGAGSAPGKPDLETLIRWINATCPRLRIVPPQNKRLACGDVGVGAMAELADLVAAVRSCVAGEDLHVRRQGRPGASAARIWCRRAGLAGGVAVVIDVLRATTTIDSRPRRRLHRVRPCAEVEEARGAGRTDACRPGAARRRARRRSPAGFDLGNSPQEYTPKRLPGQHAGADDHQRHPGACCAQPRRSAPCWRLSSITAPSANNCARRHVLIHILCAGTAARWPSRTRCWPGALVDYLCEALEVQLNDAARLAWDCFENHGRVLLGALEVSQRRDQPAAPGI